ncbi:MAG: hypothetical protein WDM88_06830 [Galbitalea sp.]
MQHSDARLVDAQGNSLGLSLWLRCWVSNEDRAAIAQGRAFEVYLRRNLATGGDHPVSALPASRGDPVSRRVGARRVACHDRGGERRGRPRRGAAHRLPSAWLE